MSQASARFTPKMREAALTKWRKRVRRPNLSDGFRRQCQNAIRDLKGTRTRYHKAVETPIAPPSTFAPAPAEKPRRVTLAGRAASFIKRLLRPGPK